MRHVHRFRCDGADHRGDVSLLGDARGVQAIGSRVPQSHQAIDRAVDCAPTGEGPFRTRDEESGRAGLLGGRIDGGTGGANALDREGRVVKPRGLADVAVFDRRAATPVARAMATWAATPSGSVLTAHVAQFVETRDGRIASIETFDGYEPFE